MLSTVDAVSQPTSDGFLKVNRCSQEQALCQIPVTPSVVQLIVAENVSGDPSIDRDGS